MNTFHGITLGPVADTLGQAKKTRELWAFSFILSYLMREILLQIGDKHIISPSMASINIDIENGVCGYPDRAYCTSLTEVTMPIFQTAIESIANRLAETGKESQMCDSLKSMLRIASIKLEGNESLPLKRINEALNGAEFYERLNPNNGWKDCLSYDKLYTIAFGPKGNLRGKGSKILLEQFNMRRVFSVVEIANREFERSQQFAKLQEEITNSSKDRFEDEENKNVLNFKKNIGKQNLRMRNNYMCLVQADGDNIGSNLENNPELLKQFSPIMEAFAKDAVNQIVDFGGHPIYAGGDDLLFIAPLVNKSGEHILSFLKKLNNNFKSPEMKSIIPSASLSFGLSISYYKFPLQEALEASRKLLFQKAKNIEGKNAISFALLKHSGQNLVGSLKNESVTFDIVEKMISSTLSSDFKGNNRVLRDSKEDIESIEPDFLTSIMYKLMELPEETIVKAAHSEDTLRYFFGNQFNEKPHSLKCEFLKQVQSLMLSLDIRKTEEGSKVNQINSVQNLYTILRLIHFFIAKEHE